MLFNAIFVVMILSASGEVEYHDNTNKIFGETKREVRGKCLEAQYATIKMYDLLESEKYHTLIAKCIYGASNSATHQR